MTSCCVNACLDEACRWIDALYAASGAGSHHCHVHHVLGWAALLLLVAAPIIARLASDR